MIKEVIQDTEICISIDPTVVSSVSLLSSLSPNLESFKSKTFNAVTIASPYIAQHVIVVSSSLDYGTLVQASIISSIIPPFMLIDLPQTVSLGKIYTSDTRSFLGFLLPITLKAYPFSIGYMLSPSIASCSLPVLQVYLSLSLSGSGVGVSASLLITNAHVIKNSNKCVLGQFEQEGRVVKKGKTLDLAAVKCERPIGFAKLAQRIFEGQSVITAGFAILGSDQPVITSGYLRKIVCYRGVPVIGMISAKTFNGQSGGGVFNEEQELIGIVTSNVENQSDRVYNDLGLCILNPVFSAIAETGDYKEFINSYLWEECAEEFANLFTFQTTTYLPFPKI